jgi:hypothetical protein
MPLLSTIGAAAARAFGFLRALVTGGYNVANSLRFNSGSSDNLSIVFGSAETSNKIGTLSFWFKTLGTNQQYLVATNTGTIFYIFFNSSTGITFQNGAATTRFTTQVFRDPSAWYHLVVAWDTTQGTASNRQKMYLNGSEITAFSTSNDLSLNQVIPFFDNDGSTKHIGSYTGGGYYSGYISEFYGIDGQALTPSSFGETDPSVPSSGIWQPKAYTGSFGTNGFYLKFANSAALGTDSSGNGNTFTVNNLTSVDQSTDTPTNNFCTWNPLYVPDTARANTYSDGNLKAGIGVTGGNWITTFANFSPSQGKWYWEIKPKSLNTTLALGIYFGQYTTTGSYPFDANVFGCHQNGLIYYNGSTYSYMASYTSDDIVTFALDMDNGKFYMGKNGSWANGSGSTNQTFANAVSITDDIPASFPTGKDVFPILTAQDAFGEANFGSPMYAGGSNTDGAGFGNFSYAVPSGYYALCTKNLADYG